MKKNNILTLASVAVVIVLLFIFNKTFDSYQLRILNLCGVYVILALGMNLINGFTGLFSLGHAGFMAVGAYTASLLTMSPVLKDTVFYAAPINPIILKLNAPFPIALLAGGITAAIAAVIIGTPVLRLKDDYLAIATLGFSEIIRVVFTNLQSITNGALGLKGITRYTNTGWSWGIALLTILFIKRLIDGSYGKAMLAIREDEIAAEAMGISLFKHKLFAFVIGAFFAGVGGGLLAHMIGTIDPLMFRFILTFNILLIVVLGGIGSITGTVISACVVTIMMEVLRVLEGTMNFGFFTVQGIPGMRMVVFSFLLMSVILWYPRGLMGTNEFNWEYILKGKFYYSLKEKFLKKFSKNKTSGDAK